MSALFAMGGYAAYVWPAYGVSALLLGGAIVVTWRLCAAPKAQLAALEKP